MHDAILKTELLKPNSTSISIKPESIREVTTRLLNQCAQVAVSAISGVDLGKEIELNYHMRVGDAITTIRTRVSKENPNIKTIVDLIPGADFFERENYDLLGVSFENHPNLNRLVLPENWPERNYPLRKDWKQDKNEKAKPEQDRLDARSTPEQTTDGTVMNLTIGPQHPALVEPEKFTFKVDGEIVRGVEPRIGYVHRGIEKAAENLSYLQDVYLVERICGICNTCHTTCFCQAVETILNVQIPPRAQYIRTIMNELNRIHSHLLLLGTAGLEIGYETLFQYTWRDREPIMDIIEAISGNRVLTAINTIGGVRRDLTPDLIEKTKKTLVTLRSRMSFYKRIFSAEQTIGLRTRDIGVLKEKNALRFCVVGPVARGSGLKIDIRKDDPYAAYGEIPFNVITYDMGDSWARLMVRVDEVLESINIIEYAIDHMPSGSYRLRVPRVVPPGEAINRVEAPRGELFYYVKSNGTTSPERVKVRTPTLANILSFVEIAKGCNVADVPPIFVSLDPCFSCTDR